MKLRVPQPGRALPGREDALEVPETHYVNGNRIVPPFPAGLERAVFGMGCSAIYTSSAAQQAAAEASSRPSFTPRTITSSTWRRTRTAIAASAALA